MNACAVCGEDLDPGERRVCRECRQEAREDRHTATTRDPGDER